MRRFIQCSSVTGHKSISSTKYSTKVLDTENSKVDQILTIIDSQAYKISDQIYGQFYNPILILGLVSVDRILTNLH